MTPVRAETAAGAAHAEMLAVHIAETGDIVYDGVTLCTDHIGRFSGSIGKDLLQVLTDKICDFSGRKHAVSTPKPDIADREIFRFCISVVCHFAHVSDSFPPAAAGNF